MRAPEGMSKATGQAARRRRPGRPVLTGLALAGATGLAVLAGPGTGSAAVAAGPATAAGTRYVEAWGSNINGQLGNGSTVNAGLPVKVHLPAGTRVTQLRAGCEFTLALTSAGQVLAWGGNNEGELGNGSNTATPLPVKVRLPAGTRITAIRTGCRHGLALTAAGQVLAWGSDYQRPAGQRHQHRHQHAGPGPSAARHQGDGDQRGRDLQPGPHRQRQGAGLGEQLRGGAGQRQHGRQRYPGPGPPARHQQGDVFGGRRVLRRGWHLRRPGVQLGSQQPRAARHRQQRREQRHAGARRDQPIASGPVRSLFAGCGHVLALFSPRLLLAWGANKYGELGIGSITPFSNVPVKVHLPAGRKIKAVSASCTDSLALTAGGDVLAWGDNSMDQLGDDGSPDPAVAPVDVDLPLGWQASSLGAGPDARSEFAMVYKVKA